MKLVFASDIHGSAYYCAKLLEQYQNEQADKLILLGDILYHGPRNALPKEYAPMEVAQMLNAHKQEILCVRGNCDAEVDQMVLEFPIMADYAVLSLGDRMAYITHGHIHNSGNLPMMRPQDLLILNGHTHIPACIDHGWQYLNPGSVSIPKEDNVASYMVYEDGKFVIKAVETGETVKELTL